MIRKRNVNLTGICENSTMNDEAVIFLSRRCGGAVIWKCEAVRGCATLLRAQNERGGLGEYDDLGTDTE